MSVPLLKTKLYIPPKRPNLVFRPRLMLKLDEALKRRYRLILVSAKAGSGKTTLLSEWVQQQKRPVGWLALDVNDNDPRRFCSYMIAALNQLDIAISPSISSYLDMPQMPQAEVFMGNLINDLAASSTSFILVIDDYHLIQDEWIHQAVEFFVEHQPPDVHLIIVTRVDPPLSLARMRGRGQVSEIRDEDLRFRHDESRQFLNEVMELDLTAEELSSLDARTEGWIVGLQLAAISMHGRKQDGDLISFINAFSGTDRFILDYLMEEVLSQQSSALQGFLLQTSILPRMCAALCDAVTFDEPQDLVINTAPQDDNSHFPPTKQAGDGSADGTNGQANLIQLEQANLFVIALDNERKWYRYHHLFADLLYSTLKQRKSEADIRQLHHRASVWFQGEGYLEEAMAHALAAQDFERAAAMIDENIVSMLSRSEAPILLGWIEKLPKQIAISRPWVDVYRAYTLALSGEADEADLLLDGVEMRIDALTPRFTELLGHIAAIRSYTANLRGNALQVFEMAALAEKYIQEKHLVARGMAAYALANTYYAGDNIESASQESLKMLDAGEKLDRLLMIVTAICDLATMKKAQGLLHQAEDLYGRAHQWLVDRQGLDTRLRCPFEIGLADLRREWDQLEAAHEHVLTGIQYGRRFNIPSLLVSGYVVLMYVLKALGDIDGALAALQAAEQILAEQRVRLPTQIELKTSQVVYWLAVGDGRAASRWANECNGGSELEQIALARLQLAKGRPEVAQKLLDQQRSKAEAGGRIGRLIEILALSALTLKEQNHLDTACATLAQALSLARPEGYKRIFLDFGWPMYKLLEEVVRYESSEKYYAAANASSVAGYERFLLDAFAQNFKQQKIMRGNEGAQQSALDGSAIDPLTDRELEVLILLAEGISNIEIAGRLIVAPSTVKQHLKNVYSKLDVHNRTQAVKRGKEIGIL